MADSVIQQYIVEIETRSTRTVKVAATSIEEAKERYPDRGVVVHSEAHPEQVMSVVVDQVH